MNLSPFCRPGADGSDPRQLTLIPRIRLSSRTPGFQEWLFFCGGRSENRVTARKKHWAAAFGYLSNPVSGTFFVAGTSETLKFLRAAAAFFRRPPQHFQRSSPLGAAAGSGARRSDRPPGSGIRKPDRRVTGNRTSAMSIDPPRALQFSLLYVSVVASIKYRYTGSFC